MRFPRHTDHCVSAFTGASTQGMLLSPTALQALGRGIYHCSNLAAITFSDSITNIGNGHFSSVAILAITIPDSVISIGEYAFYNCSSLSDITFQ